MSNVRRLPVLAIFGADLRQRETARVAGATSLLPFYRKFVKICDFLLSSMMEESEDRKEGYYQVAKRLRTEQETGVKELEDGKEEEDSAAEEAAGNGCTENRRSGGKVRHTILILLYLNKM